MTAPPNPVLAERARQDAEQHPPRSPERRAAAAVHAALTTTTTLTAARKALTEIATDRVTHYRATVLLRLLAERDDDTTAERTAP